MLRQSCNSVLQPCCQVHCCRGAHFSGVSGQFPSLFGILQALQRLISLNDILRYQRPLTSAVSCLRLLCAIAESPVDQSRLLEMEAGFARGREIFRAEAQSGAQMLYAFL